MTAQHRIEPAILTILANCVVDGNLIMLPPKQLDRKTYQAVNTVLDLMGGKWNRTKKAHVFAEPPIDLMDTVLLTGEITDTKKLFQQFFTPGPVADQVIEAAGIRLLDHVLEPNGGKGALISALRRYCNRNGLDWKEVGCNTVTVELDPRLCTGLEATYEYIHVRQMDFLDCTMDNLGYFDRILMNPPFTRGQDVKHILHATKFIDPVKGGSTCRSTIWFPRGLNCLPARSRSPAPTSTRPWW